MIEVGCEEIPARFVDFGLEKLRQVFTSKLTESELSFKQIRNFATPRRLVVVVDQLSDRQPDRTELVIGPPASVAFSSDGTPTPAAAGFAKKHGLALEELSHVETDKGRYLGFERKILGKSSREILPQLVSSALSSLEFPKRMKWEESQFLFVRPIRWLTCFLHDEILPVSLAGISASKTTYGHRVLTDDLEIQVNTFEEYKRRLFESKVQIDPALRLESILSMLERASRENGANLVKDESLIKTVVNLNEWPSVICGAFASTYLRLPREVLVTVMREHQKYFSLENDQGQLLPRFLAVVDADPAFHPLITSGHERVLRARLADASFFWDADLKVNLEDRREKLKSVIFQEGLGTLYDKSGRIELLADRVARALKSADLVGDVTLAAKLCKVDLTTEMVKEFTDLQGVMGGLYAKVQKLGHIADAIYDHYKPTTLEDSSPRNLVGAIVSLSDKLDSLIAAFSIGLIPTGSRDPFALRRLAHGLSKVLLDYKLSLSLRKLSSKAYSILKRKRLPKLSLEETLVEFEKFIKDRLKFVFKELGYRYDEINAIVEVGCDNPYDCLERLAALSAMRKSLDFYSLAVSFKRIKNILVKAGVNLDGPFSVDPQKFQVEEEGSLHARIQGVLPQVNRATKRRAYREAFELMAGLRPDLDLFFEKVLVMAEDPSVRGNRLGLLGTLLVMFKNTADISEIVVNGE
jgi:glycyl-tRNA synthetase beta chain